MAKYAPRSSEQEPQGASYVPHPTESAPRLLSAVAGQGEHVPERRREKPCGLHVIALLWALGELHLLASAYGAGGVAKLA